MLHASGVLIKLFFSKMTLRTSSQQKCILLYCTTRSIFNKCISTVYSYLDKENCIPPSTIRRAAYNVSPEMLYGEGPKHATENETSFFFCVT